MKRYAVGAAVFAAVGLLIAAAFVYDTNPALGAMFCLGAGFVLMVLDR